MQQKRKKNRIRKQQKNEHVKKQENQSWFSNFSGQHRKKKNRTENTQKKTKKNGRRIRNENGVKKRTEFSTWKHFGLVSLRCLSQSPALCVSRFVLRNSQPEPWQLWQPWSPPDRTRLNPGIPKTNTPSDPNFGPLRNVVGSGLSLSHSFVLISFMASVCPHSVTFASFPWLISFCQDSADSNSARAGAGSHRWSVLLCVCVCDFRH